MKVLIRGQVYDAAEEVIVIMFRNEEDKKFVGAMPTGLMFYGVGPNDKVDEIGKVTKGFKDREK